MKHQYFGDIIDLFKFDLLKNLILDLKLNKITFIPMLTENDKTTEGSKRNYEKAKAGTKNIELINFLNKYEDINLRNVTEIEKYFNSINIQFNFFSDKIFIHNQRKEYFFEIAKSNFKNQLLFFDPDNGLQVKKSNHKHIMYNDIYQSLNALCDNSVISVIQFRHRYSWVKTLEKKLHDLKESVSPHVTFIANNNIAFFIIAKSQKRLVDIQTFLIDYKSVYPTLVIE